MQESETSQAASQIPFKRYQSSPKNQSAQYLNGDIQKQKNYIPRERYQSKESLLYSKSPVKSPIRSFSGGQAPINFM